jgi:hypothetical protein
LWQPDGLLWQRSLGRRNNPTGKSRLLRLLWRLLKSRLLHLRLLLLHHGLLGKLLRLRRRLLHHGLSELLRLRRRLLHHGLLGELLRHLGRGWRLRRRAKQ